MYARCSTPTITTRSSWLSSTEHTTNSQAAALIHVSVGTPALMSCSVRFHRYSYCSRDWSSSIRNHSKTWTGFHSDLHLICDMDLQYVCIWVWTPKQLVFTCFSPSKTQLPLKNLLMWMNSASPTDDSSQSSELSLVSSGHIWSSSPPAAGSGEIGPPVCRRRTNATSTV